MDGSSSRNIHTLNSQTDQSIPNKNKKKNRNTRKPNSSIKFHPSSNQSGNKETNPIVSKNQVQAIHQSNLKNIPPSLQVSNQLALQIREYIRNSTPSQTLLIERKKLVVGLSHIINQSSSLNRTPRARPYTLEVFGSISSGLDSIHSDLDICIIDPDRPQGLTKNDSNLKLLPPVYNMRKVGSVLQQCQSFNEINAIATAKTPIVKFSSWIKLGSYIRKLSVDLNCNNLLGCRNSKLIASYSNISSSNHSDGNLFKSLAFIIKLWAKSRGCCDPSGQNGPISASSYTLILLLIGYLQVINHLPNLQDPAYLLDQFDPRNLIHVAKSKKGGLIAIDTSFLTSPPSRTRWSQSYPSVEHQNYSKKSDEILTQCLIGFFQFYSAFDFDKYLISIRDGKPLQRDFYQHPSKHHKPHPHPSNRNDHPTLTEHQSNSSNLLDFTESKNEIASTNQVNNMEIRPNFETKENQPNHFPRSSSYKDKEDKRSETRHVGSVPSLGNKEVDSASQNLAILRESLMSYPAAKAELEGKKSNKFETKKIKTRLDAEVGPGKPPASTKPINICSSNGSKVNSASSDLPVPRDNSIGSGIPILHFDHMDDSLPSPRNFSRAPTVLSWPHPMVVVDPFVYDRNTSGNIKAATSDRIRHEFTRALTILINGGCLNDLCSP